MRKIVYTEDFKSRVKAVYGRYDAFVRDMLDDGSPLIGRILNETSELQLSPGDVVRLLRAGHTEALYDRASLAMEREALYHEWVRDYRNR